MIGFRRLKINIVLSFSARSGLVLFNVGRRPWRLSSLWSTFLASLSAAILGIMIVTFDLR
jgi:hypothetical protein